jgi:hypothetical protein
MIRLKSYLVFICLACCPVLLFACLDERRPPTPPLKGNAQTPSENIDEMLELSGLRKQIEQIPAGVKSGLAQQQQRAQRKLSPEEYERVLKILMDSYNASDLIQSMEDYFKEHYDHDLVSAELKILRSPLSMKLAELGTQVSTPEAQQEIQKYGQQLQSKPPPPERKALVRKLDRITGTTDFTVEVLVAISMAYIRVSNDNNPTEKRLNQDQLKQIADRMRRELRIPVENLTTVTFLYMFRDTPDAELKDYIKLYESDTADWFNQLANAALINAITAAAEKAGNQMAKMAPKPST